MDNFVLPAHYYPRNASSEARITQQIIENEKYKLKHKSLRKAMKNMIFENAALCDEVAKTQEKTLRAKEERRFLLKKLMQVQAVSDVNANHVAIKTSASTTGALPEVVNEPSARPPSTATANAAFTCSNSTSDLPSSDQTVKGKRKINSPSSSSSCNELLLSSSN